MAIEESRNGKPSGIQLVQVEGFLEVARRGSVSRAAESLFITQPTLTARLQGLERELGTPLFLRTPHGMRLTDAGRAWIPFAERALRALVDGRDALEQVMTASAGHLMIAAAPAVSTYVLPDLLERFVAAHPRVEVSVRTGHSEDVVELVLRDEVQIGLGRAIRHPDLELRAFHTEDLVLVCAPDHPFTQLSNVTMAQVFFFQAEDGIRDVAVTGVQTCALPILIARRQTEVARIRSIPFRFLTKSFAAGMLRV